MLSVVEDIFGLAGNGFYVAEFGAVDRRAGRLGNTMASLTDIKRGDTGIFTQEGNAAGSRAARQAAKREKAMQEYEKARTEVTAKHGGGLKTMDQKFAVANVDTSKDFAVRICRLFSAGRC